MFGRILHYVSTLPSVVSIHLLHMVIRILFVTWTPQDHSVVLPCIFMGESSSQHVTILKNLVTIGILIRNRKMLHQKHEYNKDLLPLKNWVNWITTRQEKWHSLKNVHFEKKCPKIIKTYFSIWLPSIRLLLKQRPVEPKRSLSPMLLCMFNLFILKRKNSK